MSDAAPVVIVGGGPAGALLALLLAERDLPVTLIERQSDFEREFRGEVLMPSGLRALAQAGVRYTDLPHREIREVLLHRARKRVARAALAVGPDSPLVLPQTPLLEHLVARAGARPGFEFIRGGSVRGLLESGDFHGPARCDGVSVKTADGTREIAARFVVGADGRASAVRRAARIPARDLGAPMDIVWARVPWPDGLADDGTLRAYAGGGHLLLAFPSPGGFMQFAWVILKGTYGDLRRRGVELWVAEMADHVSEDLATSLRSARDRISRPFLLDARTDHVECWTRPGLLLIGDAAHTMSPVGAQGINVALRDAIVAANELVPVLQNGGTAQALDAAAARVEAQRRPEIERIQELAALPPRLVMRPGALAELARALLPRLALGPLGRRFGAPVARAFLDGTTAAELRV